MLCADCKSRRTSSILSIITPALSLLPKLEGEFIEPSDILFRFPGQSDRVNASKVSPSAPFHSINVCRCDLDASVSTPGSNDPL